MELGSSRDTFSVIAGFSYLHTVISSLSLRVWFFYVALHLNSSDARATMITGITRLVCFQFSNPKRNVRLFLTVPAKFHVLLLAQAELCLYPWSNHCGWENGTFCLSHLDRMPSPAAGVFSNLWTSRTENVWEEKFTRRSYAERKSEK